MLPSCTAFSFPKARGSLRQDGGVTGAARKGERAEVREYLISIPQVVRVYDHFWRDHAHFWEDHQSSRFSAVPAAVSCALQVL